MCTHMQINSHAWDMHIDDPQGIVRELLAVPAGPETRAFVLAELRKRREAAGLDKGKLLRDRQAAERVLREVAHVVLSLPEAQLN